MDLSDNVTNQNMMRSILENTEALRRAILENPQHQEDVKLYGQLPGYGELQGYDLGRRHFKSDCPDDIL